MLVLSYIGHFPSTSIRLKVTNMMYFICSDKHDVFVFFGFVLLLLL